MNDYKVVAGMVQFDPKERSLSDGREVRSVLVRAIGSNKQVSVTVWPSHAHVNIKKGDFVVADGAYEEKPGQNQKGESVTYHTLSATYFICFSGDPTAPAATDESPKEPFQNSNDDFNDLF